MPTILRAPPDPAIANDFRGQAVVYLSFVWSGGRADGERALAPLRKLGVPISETVGWQPYSNLFDPPDRDGVPSDGVASRGLFIETLDDASIVVIQRRLAEPSASETLAQLRVLGGAMARVPNDAAAFGWRDRAAIL